MDLLGKCRGKCHVVDLYVRGTMLLSIIDSVEFFCAFICNVVIHGMIIYTLAKRTNNHPGSPGNNPGTTYVCVPEQSGTEWPECSMINASVLFLCLSPFMVINMNNIFNRNGASGKGRHVHESATPCRYRQLSAKSNW